MAFGLAGCGATAPDANEPNDELGAATVLVPGTPLDGVIGEDDTDSFRCDVPGTRASETGEAGGEAADDAVAPSGDLPRPFVVTVLADDPGDLALEVGASIPGVWEGITWPGWDVVVKDDRLEVAAALRGGTVVMILTGAEGAAYSIGIVWE